MQSTEQPCCATASGAPVYLYHIGYSPETVALREPGYLLLDNTANPRPDWFEYWPIREFLLGRALDENAYYGFFSPRFREKTFLSFAQVAQYIGSRDADVYTFSPQPDIGALFLNVFEGGEMCDRGYLATCDKFVKAIGLNVQLAALVMDSRTVVHSNYLVARPEFWRRWLAINERLFALAEGIEPSDFRDELVQPTDYKGGAQRKVFMVERMASLLLTLQPCNVAPCDPYLMGWSTQLSHNRLDAIISDALKIAFRDLRYGEYLWAYNEVRKRVFKVPG
jgi:hypothetical protein